MSVDGISEVQFLVIGTVELTCDSGGIPKCSKTIAIGGK